MKNYYDSIDTLPADRYEKIKETGYLDLLSKHGKKLPIKQLSEIWEDILLQASDYILQISNSAKLIFDKEKSVTELEANYDYINAIINYLAIAGEYDETFTKVLAGYGYRINPKKDIYKELEKLRRKVRNTQIHIDSERDELQELRGSNEDNRNINKALIYIQKHNGRQIKLSEISTKEWLTLQQDYSDYIDSIKKAKHVE